MGLLDRISRLVRSNISQLVNGAEDPEKILQQTVADMQGDLVSMRQAVAQAIATQKRTERQREQATRTAEEWYNRAQLALQKGDEVMAKEALGRRQSYAQTAQSLSDQITQQTDIVQQLKANMGHLERKLSDARTQKDMYIARARAAQSSVRLNEMMMSNAPGGLGAFEKMEARVLDLEAQAEATAELGADSTDSVERQFSQLENQGSLDQQLDQLKAKMIEGTNPSSPH